MKPEQFVYWLQGFVELARRAPTPEEWQSICEHLAKVFEKQTPPVGQPLFDPETLGKILRSPDTFKDHTTPYIPPTTAPSTPWEWEGLKIICGGTGDIFYCGQEFK